jgi:hypothetical protein
VQGSDKKFYAAKFAGNPQGNRTLINEWIATHLMQQVGVCTAQVQILELSATLAASEGLHFSGNPNRSIESGLHFGSAYPADPEKIAIFDFLPSRMLSKVINREDFATAFVMDTWLHQTDRRQSVFIRAKNVHPIGFRAFFIDHGFCFHGSAWEIRDWPNLRDAGYREFYSEIEMETLCKSSLARITQLSQDSLNKAIELIPASWFNPGDQECLDALIRTVWLRHSKLPDIVSRRLASTVI